jgi:hypothetical protein
MRFNSFVTPGQGAPPRISLTAPYMAASGLGPTLRNSVRRTLSAPNLLGRAICFGVGLLIGIGNAVIAAADSPAQNNKSTAALVAAYNASGQQLLGKLAGTPNVVLSPYSVGTAMAMILAGARGETAAEMIEVLGHNLPSERIAIANAEVRTVLQTYDGQPRRCPTWWSRCNGQIGQPQAKLLTANALMSGRRELISDNYTALLRENTAPRYSIE